MLSDYTFCLSTKKFIDIPMPDFLSTNDRELKTL